jgi:hypothetical protein
MTACIIYIIEFKKVKDLRPCFIEIYVKHYWLTVEIIVCVFCSFRTLQEKEGRHILWKRNDHRLAIKLSHCIHVLYTEHVSAFDARTILLSKLCLKLHATEHHITNNMLW